MVAGLRFLLFSFYLYNIHDPQKYRIEKSSGIMYEFWYNNHLWSNLKWQTGVCFEWLRTPGTLLSLSVTWYTAKWTKNLRVWSRRIITPRNNILCRYRWVLFWKGVWGYGWQGGINWYHKISDVISEVSRKPLSW
jgi:hypothetical protein